MNILSFDIGGTAIKYGVINTTGEILFKDSIKTENNGELIIEKIVSTFNTYKTEYSLEGIGISAPGVINSNNGYMKTGGAIRDFDNFNLKEKLEGILNVSVEIENDANCVALAEKWLGNAKECTDFIVLTIGTGIGGGLYLNDKLYTGSGFMAGELGYIINNGLNNAVPEMCMMNNTTSTYALRRSYSKYTKESMESVSGEYVFDKVKEGDIRAENLVNSFYDSLATGLNNIFFILNPQKILIGGGISRREDIIFEISRRLRSYCNLSKEFEVDRCKFLNDSGIIGAVKNYMVKQNLK